MGGVIDAILKIVAVGGGATVLAYGIFVWLGKRWLEQEFSKDLERFRHEQAKEIEHMRHQINSLLSRVTKIHEREFEVLPTAWRRLHTSYGLVSQACSMLKQFPDLGAMSEPQLDEFLVASTKLPNYRKDEIRRAAMRDRLKIYQEAMFWVELADAREAQSAFHNYLVENRIFMTDELWAAFSDVDDQLNRALVAFEVGKEAKDFSLRKESSDILRNLDGAVEKVERGVQKRLHYEDA